jgi:hypothetical protein
LSNVKNTTEYSRIGKGTEDFSRLKNVIGNINNAKEVTGRMEDIIEIHYVTINRGKEMHRIIYKIDPMDLTDNQKVRVLARLES